MTTLLSMISYSDGHVEELTKEQLAQQDKVDNAIKDFLEAVLPQDKQDNLWRADVFVQIRDIVVDSYELDLKTWYPYLEK